MKQQELIPALRFKEFSGEWEEFKISKLFSIFNGYAFSSSDAQSEGAKWVKIADVGINEMKEDSLSYLPLDYKEKHAKFLLKENDYVVALTRPILNGKLKIAKINKSFNGSLLNQRVGKLLTENSLGFVYSMLQKNSLISRIENRIAGTDPPNLSPNEISSIRVSIPNLPEQQKIASFLTAVDTKLQQLNTKRELLAQYKKGVMQQLFSQQLRFKRDDGGDFEDWEEKKLGEVFKFKQGFQFPVEEQYDVSFENSVYFIRIVNVTSSPDDKRYVRKPEEHHILTKSDLFMVRYGDAGRIATGFEGIIANNMFRLIPKIEVCEKWFFFYLDSIYEKIHVLAGSSTMPAIKFGTIENLKINTPSLPEQQKIASYLNALDAKIAVVQEQVEEMQVFKKGLLQGMFV